MKLVYESNCCADDENSNFQLFVSFFFDRRFGYFKRTVATVLMVPFVIDEFRAW